MAGLVVLYSASGQSEPMMTAQIRNLFIAFAVLLITAQLRLETLKIVSPYVFALGLVLLVGVAFWRRCEGCSTLVEPWFYSLPAFGNYESGNASCDRMVAFEEGPAPNLKVITHCSDDGGSALISHFAAARPGYLFIGG